MAAAYDSYDYPSYWLKRSYEHNAECLAIKNFLGKIPSINKILEIGAGYGRLVPSYIFRAKEVTLTDPSAKLLSQARKKFKEGKIKFIQSLLETLPRKLSRTSFGLVILIRVLHHITNTQKAFDIISDFISPHGFFLLEFPNKNHLKAILSEAYKGNFSFAFNRSPLDISSENSKKNKALRFFNYAPEYIEGQLKSSGFKIIEKLSVSNIRSTFVKRHLSLETLLFLEKHLQKPLSFLNFGPSVFILAQKTA